MGGWTVGVYIKGWSACLESAWNALEWHVDPMAQLLALAGWLAAAVLSKVFGYI